eukprot:62879-Pleurochrysis_carterae.AAC.1
MLHDLGAEQALLEVSDRSGSVRAVMAEQLPMHVLVEGLGGEVEGQSEKGELDVVRVFGCGSFSRSRLWRRSGGGGYDVCTATWAMSTAAEAYAIVRRKLDKPWRGQ